MKFETWFVWESLLKIASYFLSSRYTNDYSFETALLLSVFLGMLGMDMFIILKFIHYIKVKNSTLKIASYFLSCRYTNGYSFETALLLSVFLGMLGMDRFYLGYHAIGLAKLCTFGFLFLGQLIDIILIATQTLGPADGSHYVISYYGASINVITTDNETFRMPQKDWLIGSWGMYWF